MPGLGGHLEVRGEAAFLLGTLQEPVAREWVRKLALATVVSWAPPACYGKHVGVAKRALDGGRGGWLGHGTLSEFIFRADSRQPQAGALNPFSPRRQWGLSQVRWDT